MVKKKLSKKNIFFRFDFNDIIGSGHLSRCTNFAKLLLSSKKNIRIHFIIVNFNKTKKNLIFEKKFNTHYIDYNKVYNSRYDKFKKKIVWNKDIQDYDSLKVKGILNKFPNSILILDHYGLKYKWQKKFISIVIN